MAKYQIVIETDVYEKSPISDNYVFEGKGFAGSVNPKSPNVTVTEILTCTQTRHEYNGGGNCQEKAVVEFETHRGTERACEGHAWAASQAAAHKGTLRRVGSSA